MTLKLFRGIFALLISINGFLADNSCRYELPGRGVINLASIGLRNNQPTFRDISPLTGANYVYSFNPCYSFTEASCGNVAACQISRDGAFAFTLAEQNSSVWTYDAAKNALALTYTLQAKTVDIQMFCSEGRSHQLEVVGEVALNYYVMRLRSPCACWNGCDAPVTSSTTSKTSTTPTIYSNPCVYNHPRFGTIDLSSVGNLNGTAVFADVPTIYTDDYLWSYNPCVPFTERSCYRVAGCQKSKTLQTSFPIGLQERAQWINMNTTANLRPSIVYSTLGDERHLTVQLVCNSAASDHQLQAVGEISTNHYLMILTSRCACWNGCYSDPSPPGRHHFKWQAWMTIVSVAAGVLLCLCSVITCLICCKPKRQFHRIIIDEHTPIVRSAMDRYPTVKK